ncbi:MAG: DUF1146 domain-containing protein [Bacilli bacterium]|nr:DUF1146 domain-containing protein [Bacilli bacterium]
MSSKFFLYIAITPLVIYALSSLNINSIFKKNKVTAAWTFYFLLAISMIYLVTNCLYDVFLYSI